MIMNLFSVRSNNLLALFLLRFINHIYDIREWVAFHFVAKTGFKTKIANPG